MGNAHGGMPGVAIFRRFIDEEYTKGQLAIYLYARALAMELSGGSRGPQSGSGWKMTADRAAEFVETVFEGFRDELGADIVEHLQKMPEQHLVSIHALLADIVKEFGREQIRF